MNKILLILPTINEEKNIKPLLKQILKTKIQLDILIIDDVLFRQYLKYNK